MPYTTDLNGAILQDEEGNDLYSGITILRDNYALSITEGETEVAVLSSVNDNPSGVSSWAITGGIDSSLFSIDSSTGALSFNDPPDFETPGDDDEDNVYEIEVTLTDTNNSVADVENIEITVTDVADGSLESSFAIGIGIGL